MLKVKWQVSNNSVVGISTHKFVEMNAAVGPYKNKSLDTITFKYSVRSKAKLPLVMLRSSANHSRVYERVDQS